MMEMIKISDIIDVRDGTHDSPKYMDSGYPLITSKNLANGSINRAEVNYISETDYNKINQRSKVEQGDILYSMIGSIGNLAIVEEEPDFAIKNVALFRLSQSKQIPKYVYYLLHSPIVKEQIESQTKGGTQKFVSLSILRNLKIPLPPLSEQKRIAELLDAADSLRKKDKALLEKYDQLAQSLFLEMFGDPVKNEKGWEVKRLGDVISKLETGVSVNSTDEKFNGNSFGILKTSCVYTGEFREMEAKVILENEISRAKLNPKKDSLIVSRMNTSELVGKSAYVDKDYPNLFLPDRLWQTVPGSSVCNFRWLHYALNHSSFMDSISKIASGTSGSMKNISKQSFLNLVCIYPNISLQYQFAEQVQLIEKQKEIVKKNLDKSEELMKGVMGEVFNNTTN